MNIKQATDAAITIWGLDRVEAVRMLYGGAASIGLVAGQPASADGVSWDDTQLRQHALDADGLPVCHSACIDLAQPARRTTKATRRTR